MLEVYDNIIWGASINGILMAEELSQKGLSVLLINKYGFPGGRVTESLACSFQKSHCDINGSLFHKIRNQKYAVLLEDEHRLLLHPEAVKRALWETIDNIKCDYLFHVIPVSSQKGELKILNLFGRQGHFSVCAKEIHDLSDDSQLDFPSNTLTYKVDLRINCFINGTKQIKFAGFPIVSCLKTHIGMFCSFVFKNIPFHAIDHVFNDEIDRLAKHVWKEHGLRLIMIPVKPEIELRQ